METRMRIAEVADRSGFTPATLRYYEQVDLLPAPTRTPSGYRAYDESVLARLAFIARAKQLGCSLEEVAALMPSWDGSRCRPVQDGLRQVAATKSAEARARAAEMLAFADDLDRTLDTLGRHTPDGPCDADCGCIGGVPTCTLDPAELPGRLQDWRDVTTHVVARESLDGGVRLVLGATTPLDDVALLMRAEQSCCSFFSFALTVDPRGVALEVRAPAEALALFG